MGSEAIGEAWVSVVQGFPRSSLGGRTCQGFSTNYLLGSDMFLPEANDRLPEEAASQAAQGSSESWDQNLS